MKTEDFQSLLAIDTQPCIAGAVNANSGRIRKPAVPEDRQLANWACNRFTAAVMSDAEPVTVTIPASPFTAIREPDLD